MKLPILALFTAAITLSQVSPANPGATLKGWGKITWGMTVQQARAALGPEASIPTEQPRPNLDWIDRLVIKSVQIGDFTAHAAIQSRRNSDKVTGVRLRLADLDDTRAKRSHTYTELKRLLIQKYGSPKEDQKKPDITGNDATTFWSFPYTYITLERIETSIGGIVIVHYRAVDRKAFDAF